MKIFLNYFQPLQKENWTDFSEHDTKFSTAHMFSFIDHLYFNYCFNIRYFELLLFSC